LERQTFGHERLICLLEPEIVAPERLVVAPERLVVTPERFVVTPERFVVTPERFVVAPERFVVAPERFVVADQRLVGNAGWHLSSCQPEPRKLIWRMNLKTLVIAALALCASITLTAREVPPPLEKMPVLKANGQVYSNVSIYKVTATDISFSSDQVIGNAKLKDLDPDLQKHFHYDPNYNPTNALHQTNAVQILQKPGTNGVASFANDTNDTVAADQTEPNVRIKAAFARLGIWPVVAVLGIFLLLYIFFCYCFKLICEKCSTEPGLLIWVPIFNQIRLLQAGGLSGWLFLLFFVPFVGAVMSIYMWVKVCQARGKSGWLVILLFIPVANLFFIPYLAFSE
jgi:hypothetical protein